MSLLFVALMITLVFAEFVSPTVATKGGIISGRVICYKGNPVDDAWIGVWNLETGAHSWVRTDIYGNYTITGLAAGTYKMSVRPPEGRYLTQAFITDIEVIVGETTIVNVTLEEGGLISGRVICHEGNPVADAQVHVWNQETGARGNWANTDTDGYYTITNLTPGIYRMEVYLDLLHIHRGVPSTVLFTDIITDIVVIAGETTRVDVTLEKGGIISGRVTCYERNPIADTSVVYVWNQETGVWSGSTWTEDGYYTIIGLAPGIYRMEVYPRYGGGYLTPASITDIVVIAGETTKVDVTMEVVLEVVELPAIKSPVIVQPPAVLPPIDPPIDPPRVPGFGIIAVIVGFLGVVLIMLKKNKI